ncbi:hypothetical protein ACFL2H_01895, partial [Planctomycetota bacterium]
AMSTIILTAYLTSLAPSEILRLRFDSFAGTAAAGPNCGVYSCSPVSIHWALGNRKERPLHNGQFAASEHR